MHSKLFHFLVLLAAVFLSGCGFTLRGSVDIPPELQSMILESPGGNTNIASDLRRALTASDVTLLDTPQSGAYRLTIGNIESSERVLSVNSNARAGEYELEISVPFQLRGESEIVLGPETLSVVKVYLADPNNAVAKQEERELIETEMRRELVSRILRRLQSATL